MQSDRYLTVNGKRFHYTWLRDNCPCSACRDSSSFQKINDISSRKSLKPKSVDSQDSELVIIWNDNPLERCTIPISWLMSHTYDPRPEFIQPPEITLWDTGWLNNHPPQWYSFDSCTSSEWMNQLNQLGFTVLRNMPFEKLESFVSSIGPVSYYVKQETFVSVKATPGGNDLALSNHALSPHTDQSYMQHTHPMVLLLYCIENNASGGESIVVDGFRVAELFRQNHPEYFQILSQTPVEFRQFNPEWKYYFSHTTPILKLDEQNKIDSVYFSHKNFALNLSFEQMENFYEAYSTFQSYLNHPDYQYCFRLQPGDCLLVANFRVLHGRKAFELNSGSRHLKGAFIPWDYFIARQDFHRMEHLYLGG